MEKILFMGINKLPRQIRKKAKTFLNAIKPHSSFLEVNGFKFKESRIADEYAVDYIIEVSYYNEKIDRSLIFYYQPINIDSDMIDLVNVTIYKGSSKSYGNDLKLNMYIEKVAPGTNMETLCYPNKNPNGSFEENIKNSIYGFIFFLKDRAIGLLDGSLWDDTSWVDWSSVQPLLYEEQKKIIEKSDEENDDNSQD